MDSATEALIAQLRTKQIGAAVEPALQLAIERNQGRMRPLSTQPYMYHLVEVALHISDVFGFQDETATVLALWHDLLEDDQIERQELQNYINHRPAIVRLGDILPMLDALNRHGKTTEQYYEEIAAQPPQVFWVKASDLLSNTKPLPMLDWNHIKPQWIAKYTSEIAREVLDVGRFEAKRGYSTIRNALLDVQIRLLTNLHHDSERWHEVAMLDARFTPSAHDLLKRER